MVSQSTGYGVAALRLCHVGPMVLWALTGRQITRSCSYECMVSYVVTMVLYTVLYWAYMLLLWCYCGVTVVLH
jgi:hypothetical protein